MKYLQQQTSAKRTAGVLLLLVALAGFMTGCMACGSGIGCGDHEKGAVPAPAGDKLREWEAVQAGRALADQTTLYRADFVGSTTTLSPAAIDKIYRAFESGIEMMPWIVEPSDNPRLDQMRVLQVTEVLQRQGVAEPLVQLGVPRAIGLPGPFAESAVRNSVGNLGNGNRGGLMGNQSFGNTQFLGIGR